MTVGLELLQAGSARTLGMAMLSAAQTLSCEFDHTKKAFRNADVISCKGDCTALLRRHQAVQSLKDRCSLDTAPQGRLPHIPRQSPLKRQAEEGKHLKETVLCM